MICIGKTYRLKPAFATKCVYEYHYGFIRDKEFEYLKAGVVITEVKEVPGCDWGKAVFAIPSTLLFPTPEPEKGENRFKEEIILFEIDMMGSFEPMYIEAEVNEAVSTARKFIESVMAQRTSANLFPEIRCRNCGRCVYVGKCCDNPDIEIKE